MDRRDFLTGASALAGAGLASVPARAAEPTEITFYYPVAVGGPITKIVDGYAADFQKANADVKVRPIYAGTYQETI
ncbi:MAG: sn-glycerol 3-phosphate transport system substrate-binding protein, partial [Methylobacteriaceae bacterium]|nr:sn-glycerol 3-phosphate transport system substrate-binding protein [Methylobacteriaceae bacterium]